MTPMSRIQAALAGQPNSGKSTVFNMLTGARQYVANYPGVTVEKKSGFFSCDTSRVKLIDLPGTYSLTSYSLEERVARDFLLHERPKVVVNVVDASNLKRNLYLTFQLLEMEIPVVLCLNMMDVAERRGLSIDAPKLAERLKAWVVPAVAKRNKGKDELRDAVVSASQAGGTFKPFNMDYGPLEPFLSEIEEKLSQKPGLAYPARWLAVKLMEDDHEARKLIQKDVPNPGELLDLAVQKRKKFTAEHHEVPERHTAYTRHLTACRIHEACVKAEKKSLSTLSDKIDRVACHRYLGPLILIGVIYALYELSIVQGYNLTNYTWPLLAGLRNLAAGLLPDPGFTHDPLIRSLILWFTDSVNALLNYIPIFFILFSLIAVLEDSGYMPRMAFLLDRVFRRFGLHGQSTLPLILGGVYVGGCAIPGVMACKAIPDERARLATILIVPLMNCLAKVPLYILLVSIYFPEHKGLAMFFMATVTLFMALPVAKLLTLTVLKKKESAPFILEMPPYHFPTVQAVLRRAVERVWLFLKKIVTIVAAVAIVIFVLLQFPGLSQERKAHYEALADKAKSEFHGKIQGNPYAEHVQGRNLMALILFQEKYKQERRGVKDKEKARAIDARFQEKNPAFFSIIKPKKDKDAKKVNKAFKKVVKARKKIRREIQGEKINASFLGSLGAALEPVTKWAGFNWRVNVALLSAFAAKESTVATLGTLYQQEESGSGETLESRMKEQETGFTALNALTLMLFMALYPPCIATTIMVKLQSGEIKWMLFSMVYPMVLGITFSSLVFTGGRALGLTGLQAMLAFYGLCVAATVGLALYNPRRKFSYNHAFSKKEENL